jgi:hypothetical protein
MVGCDGIGLRDGRRDGFLRQVTAAAAGKDKKKRLSAAVDQVYTLYGTHINTHTYTHTHTHTHTLSSPLIVVVRCCCSNSSWKKKRKEKNRVGLNG